MIYELRSENLSHLGGPMGSEYTTTNWRKYFKSLDSAMVHAAYDYKKLTLPPPKEGYIAVGKELPEWIEENGKYRSPDLLFVMYHIRPIQTED